MYDRIAIGICWSIDMFGVFPLVPAYGRDYKTEYEVVQDWQAGKDFRTVSGQYCSIRDFPNMPVPIRFNLLRDVVTMHPEYSKLD